ncbi:hypothetical protein BHE90_002314 [Fusarium euwallaceae]|uniref:Uncharacterized protein n=2 Tax=Fusarium solani species complex TaxID=232080 RepID=A0A3M2S7H6_9HYPO|nr:hypothetical protein CDV36_006808 [Fusarium kuroshium]RTE83161.1 hypothetical protein BHE90_002314 [Fusarium euwallaceae]
MPPPNPPLSSTTHEHQAVDDIANASLINIKPPLPSRRPRTAQSPNNAEVLVPPLIGGAVVAAFATALSDGLNNELLTHYYLPEQKVRVNIDRVLDRLLSEFTKELWDELWSFYCDSNPESRDQIKKLFDGPICQLILILNGPEAPHCVLEKLGPGISRRPATWSTTARGIDLPLALQLLCSYWDREFPARSPRGSPDEIARSLHTYITTGESARQLISRIREVLVSPHYVQMHLMESAVWDILLKRPFRPPRDGFHVIQFKFECQLFGPLEGIGDPQLVKMGSLPAITGTANDCVYTTISEYTAKQWPKCGLLLLSCIEDAVKEASISSCDGHAFTGMSIWDGTDDPFLCPGLRLLHIEVEDGSIRLSVSAWTHTMIEILQQMAWTCAALSASPFPGSLSECAIEVSDYQYLDDSIFVDCSLSHRPVPEGDGAPWLKQLQGAAIANGFPIKHILAESHPS